MRIFQTLSPISFSLLCFCLCFACESEGCDLGGGEEATTETATPTSMGGGSASAMKLIVDGYELVEVRNTREDGAETARREREERERAQYVMEPTEPDPHGGSFTLEEAVEGLGTDGTLVAEINTTFGSVLCDLYADKVPTTVANFIGLARGKRAWWDPRAAAWRTNKPYYENTPIHSVIPGFMVQGGDILGDGTGRIGYTIPDEPHAELQHDKAGLLCMANQAENESGAQFFITDGPARHLDTEGGSTIFGHCLQTEVINQIARVPQTEGNRPRTPVVITRVRIRRSADGAEGGRFTPPRAPENWDPELPLGSGRSRGPSEQGHGGRTGDLPRFHPQHGLPGGGSHAGHMH